MSKNSKIQITYCVECGFLPMASSLAEDISKSFGLEAKLIEGGGGIYQIEIDGNVINVNQQTLCGGLSVNDQILAQVGNYLKNGVIEESMEKYTLSPVGPAKNQNSKSQAENSAGCEC